MLLRILILLVLLRTLLSKFFSNPFTEFMQCRLCRSVRLEGLISDCSCDFSSVDKSVTKFFSPILQNITSLTFFRYFRVDLEEPCPFWHEDGQCMMESCSVCTCEESEVPESWMDEASPLGLDLSYGKNGNSFGWITSPSSSFGFAGSGHNDALGRLNMAESMSKAPDTYENSDSYIKYLRDTEDDDRDWTDMSEDSVTSKVKPSPFSATPSTPATPSIYGTETEVETNSSPTENRSKMGSYVNLLQNPEHFTGYAGPSAARVWQSIQHENCFGGVDDTCVEKRVFYRLMSGLQASISTHIAKEYFYPDGHWGTNIPLFVRAVGSHPDRMSNLYFTFLFVLRAVVKAGSTLTDYPFHTGKKEDDEMVRTLVRRLVNARLPDMFPKGFGNEAPMKVKAAKIAEKAGKLEKLGRLEKINIISERISEKWTGEMGDKGPVDGNKSSDYRKELEECRNGFDESVLFQVPAHWSHSDSQYTQEVLEKQQLREEFRNRFRNITRIMDCVTCEKCKVWGKLQILGLGTAIKILLTPENELRDSKGFLNRQEVIALINTLHQLTKSVAFAAHAADLEFDAEISELGRKSGISAIALGIFLSIIYLGYRRRKTAQPDVNKQD